jgi:negative regulator of sigma-B (phosphoserine phosphatase)
VSAKVEFVTLPCEGQTENGDAAVVRRWEGGVLIAVIDALGHGAHAAKAADAAVRYLHEAPLERGVALVIAGLHDALRGTRGAAAMLLHLEGLKLTGVGVGNVDVRSLALRGPPPSGAGPVRSRIPVVLTPGVLGASLPRFKVFHAELTPGDRVIVFTDGIGPRFEEEASRRVPALEVCRAIMERHRKRHDDATVLCTDIEAP